MNERRLWLRAGMGVSLAALGLSARADDTAVLKVLQRGGVVAAFRHADAPGTFDPPDFKLGECSTQRNLGDNGRAQAQRIGAWFNERGLKPRRVRSSPWCRCLDTATLAFGEAEAWAALSSTVGGTASGQVEAMHAALRSLPAAGFEVWVTHQFTLSALVGESTSQGEALLLRAAPGAPVGTAQVIGRFRPG